LVGFVRMAALAFYPCPIWRAARPGGYF